MESAETTHIIWCLADFSVPLSLVIAICWVTS